MKTKILITTLSLLTLLAISSSFFITSVSFAQKINREPVSLLVKAPSVNLSEVKTVNISSIDQKPVNNYEYSGQSDGIVYVKPGETKQLWINFKNIGTTTWEKDSFHLGTSHAKDRTSAFANKTWLSTNRLEIEENSIEPGYIAQFKFTITAPEQSGIYYEYFRPVIDGQEWMRDIGIYWKIVVKNFNENEADLPILNKKEGAKKIVVSISQQRLTCYEDGDVVCENIISSGTVGMPTPIGNFKIQSKSPVAYSAAYGLYMNYWMPFSSDGAYGLHELPYWKYSWGIVTEGENHLGVRVSHGCVRLGIGAAERLYNWVSVGTPVEIVN